MGCAACRHVWKISQHCEKNKHYLWEGMPAEVEGGGSIETDFEVGRGGRKGLGGWVNEGTEVNKMGIGLE